MIESKNQATRKGLDGDKVAVCPHFGCDTLKRLKLLKLGIFGFHKYPKCKAHNIPLVFVDEFIGDFLQSVHACLFDKSIAPPKELRELIKNKYPNHLSSFYHKWMFCSSIGRGAKIVPSYMNSLSRAYINSLNKRQIKSIKDNSYIKKRDKLILLGLKKIELEYVDFLKKLYEINENLYNRKEIKPFPRQVRKFIRDWLEDFIKSIDKEDSHNEEIDEKDSVIKKKLLCDKILLARTCILILGRSPSELSLKISAYELFAAYHEFLDAGLCTEIMLSKASTEEILSLEKNDEISHYNRWLTENIQNYIKNLDENIKFLFEPFESFSNMSCLFGLKRNYLREQRYSKNSKNIIAVSKLKKMREGFRKKIHEWIELYPQFTKLLKSAENDIINLINEYEDKFSPLPSPYYQMYRHHPDFNRHYFAEILTLEQAYWLGFLFADGYIGLEHKTSGDYYRMGIGISEKDKSLLIDFCSAVGLNPDYIHTRMVKCSYTNEETPISKIRWGDQNFAESLIKKGMNYAYNNEIGRRVKIPVIPKLKNIELMLGFLLGFYDGDGSLGLYIHKNGKKTIFPCITSSNKEFLLQIKQYFKIKYDLYRQISMKFDFKKSKIVKSKVYKLYLGTGLFKEMLKNYKNSLKRKRFLIETLEKYGISEKKEWLKNILSKKKKLIEISDVLSPWKIGERLGLDGRTIISYAVDELRINPFKEKGHYITISNSIRWNREKSEYYRIFQYWLKYLERLGKYSE